MKPPPFDYVRPSSLAEVVALLADDAREVKVLAGGQSLVPMLNFRLVRPDLLVDIGGLEGLHGIAVDPDGTLVLGAGVRQAACARHPLVGERLPLLGEALLHIGHPQIRSRGTVGGSLAHHDPAAELPAAAVALDARLVAVSAAGRREIAAESFFVSFFETALRADELLVAVRFPQLRPRTGWSLKEVARRHGDFALVAALALCERGADGALTDVRIVVAGCGAHPIRLVAAEAHVRGHAPSARLFAEAAGIGAGALTPADDVHASALTRRDLAEVLVRRALDEAAGRAA